MAGEAMKRLTPTGKIRTAVFARADGVCECGVCGRFVSPETAEMDHAESRRVPESVSNCWALTRECHFARTNSRPDASHWLSLWWLHCQRHGYAAEAERAEARLHFVDARRAS